MDIQQRKDNDMLILIPSGELDAHSAIKMDRVIGEAVQNGYAKIIISGSRLTYISSAGVGVFVSYLDKVREGNGNFVFCHLKSSVLDVLKTLGLDKVFIITETIKEAKTSFS